MKDGKTVLLLATRSSMEHRGKRLMDILVNKSLVHLHEDFPNIKTTTMATLKYPYYVKYFANSEPTNTMKIVMEMVSIKCIELFN